MNIYEHSHYKVIIKELISFYKQKQASITFDQLAQSCNVQ